MKTFLETGSRKHFNIMNAYYANAFPIFQVKVVNGVFIKIRL